MTIILAAGFALFMALFPFSLFDGIARRRYLIADSIFYAFLAGLLLLAPLLRLSLPGPLLLVLFIMFKLLLFLTVAAFTPGDVRWSSNKGALLAFVVYCFLIPLILRAPIDGDEPYYLLATESLINDRDLDLSNQYDDMSRSATGRPDLRPQPGDPVGPRGELRSRHEPFLPALLIPGRLALGLPGAVLTIAVFGALLVRSTLRLFEEEGISQRSAILVFTLFAFGPPVLFYATRIWPEVPAGFFFVEAIRAIRQRRNKRLIVALAGLVLLKIRFLLLGLPLLLFALRRNRVSWRIAAAAAAALVLPLLIAWAITGNPLNVHASWEIFALMPVKLLRGFWGLLIDGAAGLLVQAPAFFVAAIGLVRWREQPESVRIGILSSLLYLFFLLPRDEWHGGWSPPLRYVVFLMPVLAVALASMVDRRRNFGFFVIPFAASMFIAIHGIAYPWRLFQIAGGENFMGEWLSLQTATDVSRFFPSIIRLNAAAIYGGVIVVGVLIAAALRRDTEGSTAHSPASVTFLLLASGALLFGARSPGSVVHFEDVHVMHEGGEISPPRWIIGRFHHVGGWLMKEGDALSFRMDEGGARLFYQSESGATLQADDVVISLPSTAEQWQAVSVTMRPATAHVLRVKSGSVILDRVESVRADALTRFVGRHR